MEHIESFSMFRSAVAGSTLAGSPLFLEGAISPNTRRMGCVSWHGHNVCVAGACLCSPNFYLILLTLMSLALPVHLRGVGGVPQTSEIKEQMFTNNMSFLAPTISCFFPSVFFPSGW